MIKRRAVMIIDRPSVMYDDYSLVNALKTGVEIGINSIYFFE